MGAGIRPYPTAWTCLDHLERGSRSPRSCPRPQKRPQAASTQGRKPASTEYIYMPLGRKHEAARGRKAAPTQNP